MRIIALSLIAALLAGCAVPPAGTTRGSAAGTVLLARSGLIVQDARATLVTFGTLDTQVIARLRPILGPVRSTVRNEECGGGPLTFIQFDGLSIAVDHGEFLGWVADTPALRTDARIGLGSTQTALTSAYNAQVFESTIGLEFDAEGFYGVIEQGQITYLWAGTSCVFR